MQAAATTTPQATAFAPEPHLPWLRTDPHMQQRIAFEGIELLELSFNKPYEPMALHYPQGTTVAALRITSPEEMAEGVYYLERQHDGKPHIEFGRFAGFTFADERRNKRRFREGIVHFELSSDVDVDESNLRGGFRPDGTASVHINFNNPDFRLWRFTHYVNLPVQALTVLGGYAGRFTGITDDQAQWLADEKLLLYKEQVSEYSAQVLGGFPVAECWAILEGAQRIDFTRVMESLPKLTPSQAKKRKSGAVAITWRSYNCCGMPVGYTDHFKREDADTLLGFLQNVTDLRRAQARANASSRLLSVQADVVRTLKNSEQEKNTGESKRVLAHAA